MSEQKDVKWAVRHTGGATHVYAPTREKAIAKWESMYGKSCKLQSITNAADRRALKKAAKYPALRTKEVRACRKCGCTDMDCSGCIERTGQPCYWVERDLCSACVTK